MVSTSRSHVAGDEAGGEADGVVKYLKEKRCQFWLPNKRRHCANFPLPFSPFCGNHDSSAGDHRLPCPLDPSHSVSKENLGSHLKKCPSRTQALALEAQTYYSKGINCDCIDSPIDDIRSDAKRAAIYALNLSEFLALVKKIDSLHYAIVGDLENSYLKPDACDKWFSGRINSKIPYQERHVLQQASILGNMENFGILHRPEELVRGDEEGNVDVFVHERGKLPAVVEFGAGRGYLTHMLVDSYGIKKIFLVERRAYKLKVGYLFFFLFKSFMKDILKLREEDTAQNNAEELTGRRYLILGGNIEGSKYELVLRNFLRRKNEEEEVGVLKSLLGLPKCTCCSSLTQSKTYISLAILQNLKILKDLSHQLMHLSSIRLDDTHTSIKIGVSSTMRPSKNPAKLSAVFDELDFYVPFGSPNLVSLEESVDTALFGVVCVQIIYTGLIWSLNMTCLLRQLLEGLSSRPSQETHLHLLTLSTVFLLVSFPLPLP
ncbi:hypothetical protein KSP40_PGU002758 [Platanthera guangdongensis]|uniref:tRNA:m(4)X modification enzyme TRM13 n=1 Tax=Platanthera guangdongensis TaxID=2320717 RepID=A0ABR2MTJ5_9ASPA